MSRKVDKPAPPTPRDVKMARAFNIWLDRYENDPDSFNSTWKTLKRHMAEKKQGKKPTYGEVCVEYLNDIMDEL